MSLFGLLLDVDLIAVKRGYFCLLGGEVLQSFVYVKNLVEGAYLASMSDAALGKVFFINDERPYSLREFSDEIARAFRVRRPVKLPGAAGTLLGLVGDIGSRCGIPVPITSSRVRTMTTNYVYSIGSAKRAFGYAPAHGLEAGIRETAEWYESAGLV